MLFRYELFNYEQVLINKSSGSKRDGISFCVPQQDILNTIREGSLAINLRRFIHFPNMVAY